MSQQFEPFVFGCMSPMNSPFSPVEQECSSKFSVIPLKSGISDTPQDQTEYFIFTWHVKNFSMYPGDVGGAMTSPEFVVDIFKGSKWFLILYPKGETGNKFIMCYIKCNSIGSYSREINADFTINVISKFSHSRMSHFIFEQEKSAGFSIISLEEIFNDKGTFLPNDTLTIECILSCKRENEIFVASTWGIFNTENFKDINKCTLETTIDVNRKSIIWKLNHFESLPMRKRLTVPVSSALNETPPLFITFYKLETEYALNIEIMKTNGFKTTLVKCGISVIDMLGNVWQHAENQVLFKSDQVWNFPSFINPTELEKKKYFEQSKGILCLRFDFTISIQNRLRHSEKQYLIPTISPNDNQLIPSFEKLFLDEDNSVVSLRAGTKTFSVHRRLLMENSKVFAAMFENDMKEKETGVVDIPDVEPDILGKMLAFIYSYHAGNSNLRVADAIKLFIVSDKYQVLPLIALCSSFLASSLSVYNVCPILSLADLHGNKLLMESAEAFIRSNSDRILKSKDWMDFMKTNPTLALSVMHKILIR